MSMKKFHNMFSLTIFHSLIPKNFSISLRHFVCLFCCVLDVPVLLCSPHLRKKFLDMEALLSHLDHPNVTSDILISEYFCLAPHYPRVPLFHLENIGHKSHRHPHTDRLVSAQKEEEKRRLGPPTTPLNASPSAAEGHLSPFLAQPTV